MVFSVTGHNTFYFTNKHEVPVKHRALGNENREK